MINRLTAPILIYMDVNVGLNKMLIDWSVICSAYKFSKVELLKS